MPQFSNIWVYDVETLSNIYSYTAIERDTKEVVQFVIWKHVNQLESLIHHLKNVKGLIGFNNLDFDYPILHFILNDEERLLTLSSDEITQDIYEKAQELISSEFSSVKDKYVKIPQLDLFKIWHFNNKARITSLKKLEINMRYENVQDMPYHHTEIITTYDQVKEILSYNLNDVKATHDFYNITIPKIELRKGLYDKYKLRGMNYSDSKIGEELTLQLYCQKTEQDISYVRKLRTERENFKFSECIPNYVNFETEEFNKLLNYLKSIEVTELKGSFKYSFEYQGDVYDYGTGGLHQNHKAGVYKSDDDFIIVDMDVSSLYPSLAIINRLYPEHLGEEFLEVYENELLLPRLEAKKVGDKVMNLGFKLALNSVYGKSNSEFSWLYDPLYTLKTTLAGQLSISMLVEMITTNINNVVVLQTNTDGITVKIPRTKRRDLFNQCELWQKYTNLILEYNTYDIMVIRDVNSYIAKSSNGKTKYKGVFKTYEEMIKDEEYHKSLSQAIVPKALEQYFLYDVPVEHTIMSATNIYDFCKTFNASHGWSCETIIDDVIVKQQKTNRYYISTHGKVFRKIKDDKIIEIEAGGKLVTIFNKYEEKPMDEYFIDYDYYIQECYKIIHKIDGTEERLIQEHNIKKEEERMLKEENNFLKFCINKKPTLRQYELYAKNWLLEKYKHIKIELK